MFIYGMILIYKKTNVRNYEKYNKNNDFYFDSVNFFDTHVCIAGVVNNFIGLLNKCTNIFCTIILR